MTCPNCSMVKGVDSAVVRRALSIISAELPEMVRDAISRSSMELAAERAEKQQPKQRTNA